MPIIRIDLIRALLMLIGVVIISLDIAHFYGLLPVKPGAVAPEAIELLVAFLIGLALILIKPKWWEFIFKKIANKKIENLD